MNEHFMRVEAVNFSATIYDTNNLSVIRGASLRLGTLGETVRKAVEVELAAPPVMEFEGASQVLLRMAGDAATAGKAEKAARAALAKDGWEHFSFVVATGATPETAEAMASARQFQQWTVPPCPAPNATRPDALDRVRGAPHQGKVGDEARWLSPSVKSRLDYGRSERKAFFEKRWGAGALNDVSFCQSFDDMAGSMQRPRGIAEAAQSKICVVHFDGDHFGKAATAIGSAKFAKKLNIKLDDVLRALVGGALRDEAREFPGQAPKLRLETLVWGGDDITIALPAWRALRMLRDFYGAVGDWQVGGHALTFTGGAVIAHYKTPVRKLVRMAETAMHALKDNESRGCFTVDAFESADPPETRLDAYRAQRFGVEAAAPGAFSIAGADAGALLDKLLKWKREAGESLPSRSKIHQLLGGDGAGDDGALEQGLQDYEDRKLGGASSGLSSWWLPQGSLPRSRALDLKLVLHLWDFAHEDCAEEAP